MSDRIYVLSNRSMPGIVKIGWTSRAVVERVAELSSHTGVPTEFTLVREFIVDDGLQTERVIHEHLANHRLAGNREFFQMEADEAGLAIEAILRVEHSLSRRDFGREEELLKRALPLVRNLRFIRPQLLEERMGD
jgi:hypothetical protein